MRGGFLCHAFEHPVKVGDAIEPAIISHGGDAVIIPFRQLLACLVDTYFIEERDKGMHRMFLKVPAEGLWGHMGLFGGIFQRDGFVILLHDEIIDGADADAFVLAVGGGLGTRGERHQFMKAAECFQELDKVDELVDSGAVLDHQHFIGDLGDMLGWYFESRLLVLQEVLYAFYFGELEEGVEVARCVKENIQGLDFFTALGCEIAGVAFEDMGEVGSQPVNFIRPESMHVVLCH